MQPTTLTFTPRLQPIYPVDLLRHRLVPDTLWSVIEPVFPTQKFRPQGGGRARVDARCVFIGIVYVLSSGCAWRGLPPCLGLAAGTVYRHFVELGEKDVWAWLRELAGQIEDDHEREWLLDVVDAAERRRHEPMT